MDSTIQRDGSTPIKSISQKKKLCRVSKGYSLDSATSSDSSIFYGPMRRSSLSPGGTRRGRARAEHPLRAASGRELGGDDVVRIYAAPASPEDESWNTICFNDEEEDRKVDEQETLTSPTTISEPLTSSSTISEPLTSSSTKNETLTSSSTISEPMTSLFTWNDSLTSFSTISERMASFATTSEPSSSRIAVSKRVLFADSVTVHVISEGEDDERPSELEMRDLLEKGMRRSLPSSRRRSGVRRTSRPTSENVDFTSGCSNKENDFGYMAKDLSSKHSTPLRYVDNKDKYDPVQFTDNSGQSVAVDKSLQNNCVNGMGINFYVDNKFAPSNPVWSSNRKHKVIERLNVPAPSEQSISCKKNQSCGQLIIPMNSQARLSIAPWMKKTEHLNLSFVNQTRQAASCSFTDVALNKRLTVWNYRGYAPDDSFIQNVVSPDHVRIRSTTSA